MLGKPRARTFRSFVLRALVPRMVAFSALAAALLAGQALSADRAVQAGAVEEPTSRPIWTLDDVTEFPGCVPMARWVEGTPAPVVVVQGLESLQHRRLAFDRAWALNHNDLAADDVWVLAACP